jgi:hypothetical protein
MIYLAIPYSHPDKEIREKRFQLANKIASELMKTGEYVYSPISHCHPIAQYGLPLDWAFWGKYNKVFLDICEKMIIVLCDGWEESKGIKEEIALMTEMHKPIEYLEYVEAGGNAQNAVTK